MIALRPIDLDGKRKLLHEIKKSNDDELMIWSGDHYLGEVHLSDLDRCPDEESCVTYQIEEYGHMIGIIKLAYREDGYGSIGEFVIFKEVNRNKGYGKQVLSMIHQIARERYKIDYLLLKVKRDNEQAISCYLSSGFTILKESYEKGELSDDVVYMQHVYI